MHMASWSGFWNVVYGDGYSLIDSNRIRRAFRTAIGDAGRQPYNRLLFAAVTTGTGNAAIGHSYRLAPQADKDGMGVGGGIRTVEDDITINRNVSAADVAAMQKDLSTKLSPVWPVDKSGNGGGGQRGL